MLTAREAATQGRSGVGGGCGVVGVARSDVDVLRGALDERHAEQQAEAAYVVGGESTQALALLAAGRRRSLVSESFSSLGKAASLSLYCIAYGSEWQRNARAIR